MRLPGQEHSGAAAIILERFCKQNVVIQGRGDELAERDGTNYFEKICLRGVIDGCRDKTWAFERVPNRKLEGFDDKIIEQVPNRRDCEELCLAETRYRG